MLTILLLSNCISGCQKGEQGNAGAKDDQISIRLEENYLEIFPYAELEKRGHVGLIPSMSSQYSIAFLNEDGTKTLYVYAAPIQYYIQDKESKNVTFTLIDNRIKDTTQEKQAEGYAYTNVANTIDINFPSVLREDCPITMTDENFSLQMLPLTLSDVQTAEYVEKANIIDEIKPMIQYADNNVGMDFYCYPTNLECNIELKFTDDIPPDYIDLKIKFSQKLKAENHSGGFLTFSDTSNNSQIKTILQAPLIKDQSGTVSYNSKLKLQEVLDEDEYIIRVAFDPEYTKTGNTVYCALEMRREKAADNTIYSKQNLLNTYLKNFSVIGNSSMHGIGRTMMRFNFTSTYELDADDIISASYSVYNMTHGSDAAFELIEMSEQWSSSMGNWTNQYKTGETVAFTETSDAILNFDITEEAKKWCADKTGEMEVIGLMLKACNEYQNQSNIILTNDNSLYYSVTVIHLK